MKPFTDFKASIFISLKPCTCDLQYPCSPLSKEKRELTPPGFGAGYTLRFRTGYNHAMVMHDDWWETWPIAYAFPRTLTIRWYWLCLQCFRFKRSQSVFSWIGFKHLHFQAPWYDVILPRKPQWQHHYYQKLHLIYMKTRWTLVTAENLCMDLVCSLSRNRWLLAL
jgi:hypothetical protein